MAIQLPRQEAGFLLREVTRADAAAIAEIEFAPEVKGFLALPAMPVETWPFAIQRDDRPMDMCAAIVAGKLTGKAEALTLRAFSERVADASARAFHLAEARELDRVARRVKVAPRARRAA